MKKNYLLLLLLSFSFSFAQNNETHEECGTDRLMEEHYIQFPELKIKDDNFNLFLSKLTQDQNLNQFLSKKTNQIYEIPIVVHVVSDGSPLGSENNRSDVEIISWVNHANEIFAGNSAPGISAPIPIKLVFAKITPNCTPTNGINRINASHLPKYVANGVDSQQNQAGLYQLDMTSLGKWNPNKYYNIYVVKNTAAGGIANGGWATLASNHGNPTDHAVIKQDAVVLPNRHHVLAHEFGHALGLLHTQQGSSGSTCPVNNNCTLDGDFVCDTEPTITLNQAGPCQTGQINACTGVTYAGVESNVMTYTNCYRNRFTTGQSNRAVAQLLQFRQSLLSSPVANPTNNSASLIPACTPTTITGPGNYNFGITQVKFGEINNSSNAYQQTANNFYENFTSGHCLVKAVTTIPLNSATSITIAPGSQSSVAHIIRAYIDYNNDGQFNETTERILNQSISAGSVVTASITPSSNAVLNTPLRLRIIGESNNFASGVSACYNPTRGQVEDYAVIIEGQTLSIQEENKENNIIITKLNNSVYIKSNNKIASATIYDLSGRIILNQENIDSREFTSSPLKTENAIVIVNAILENGEKIAKKIKF